MTEFCQMTEFSKGIFIPSFGQIPSFRPLRVSCLLSEMVQLTGQPKFPIFQKSETEFVWRIVPARVEFTLPESLPPWRTTHRPRPRGVHERPGRQSDQSHAPPGRGNLRRGEDQIAHSIEWHAGIVETADPFPQLRRPLPDRPDDFDGHGHAIDLRGQREVCRWRI